jgi:micrococcal nuclease
MCRTSRALSGTPLPYHLTMLPALLLCTVVGISDGDTLTARCLTHSMEQDAKPATYKVRLAEIDAPEKGQPYGQVSKLHLATLCFAKQAEIIPKTTDRYGRIVARVVCAGTDASTTQVSTGMAWVFERYADSRSPLYAAQRNAQSQRRGLWSESTAVPPWDWRVKKPRAPSDAGLPSPSEP